MITFDYETHGIFRSIAGWLTRSKRVVRPSDFFSGEVRDPLPPPARNSSTQDPELETGERVHPACCCVVLRVHCLSGYRCCLRFGFSRAHPSPPSPPPLPRIPPPLPSPPSPPQIYRQHFEGKRAVGPKQHICNIDGTWLAYIDFDSIRSPVARRSALPRHTSPLFVNELPPLVMQSPSIVARL